MKPTYVNKVQQKKIENKSKEETPCKVVENLQY
jgi:hypothetical protein